jgi:endonuclease III
MSSRAEKLEQLHKSLKKHFKYQEDSTERSVLENLLYACCLEDSRPEQADEAFAKLQQTYFDWNEVRVSTVIELGEVLGNLPNANAAGHRIKRCLQSLFETRYQYDIDDLKKANLSKATEELQAWPGMTPFVLNYVSQHALGGHAIPVGTASFDALLAADIVTPAEAEKKTLPGAERAITKTKGAEFSSLLHQFGVEYAANPKSAAALAVFKDLGVTPKPPIVVDTSKTKKAKAPPPEQLAAPKPTKGAPSKDASKGAASVKPEAAQATKVETKNTGAKETAAKDSASKEETKKESKPAAKGTEDKSKEAKPKADSGKIAGKPADKSSKADVASKSVSKPAPSPKSKPAESKSSEGKTTEGKAAEGKGAEKAEAKKPAAAPKKPTKMANNVKITKKKPK